MKVGLMARSLRPPLTGIGRYTLNLARAVSSQLPADSLRLYLTQDAIPLNGLQCERRQAPIPTPHELLRVLWEQTAVPIDCRDLDVYHSPSYTLPLVTNCPRIVTIHDLALLNPRFHNTRLHLYLRLQTSLALRRADAVITVSRATERELHKRYPRLSPKVHVIYPGLDPLFAARPSQAAVQRFLKERGQDKPYVLFVGALEPRKNIVRLIKAFELAVQESNLPHDLVLCGPLGWRFAPILEALESSPVRDRIKRLGFVEDSALPLWYAGADVFVYPSLLEGFGFPALEAMAMGTPVITSDVSSLPEVVGDAGITVSPRSTKGLAAAIQEVLTDESLASRLREAGPTRAARFDWEEAGRRTIDVYREVASR